MVFRWPLAVFTAVQGLNWLMQSKVHPLLPLRVVYQIPPNKLYTRYLPQKVVPKEKDKTFCQSGNDLATTVKVVFCQC